MRTRHPWGATLAGGLTVVTAAATLAFGWLLVCQPAAARGPAPSATVALMPAMTTATPAGDPAANPSRQDIWASLTIFVLAVFVGFEVIAKVPPTLHTPLMSGSNAISGITVVGAVVVAGMDLGFSSLIGCVAVFLAMINVVGGFLVTHRMLAMFKKR